MNFSIQTNSGIIRGDDGNRYQFAGSEWKDTVNPNRGMQVDFEVAGEDAVGIYRAPGSGGGVGADLSNLLSGEKNRVVAGVLALVLGWVGAHKWYLGLYKPAKLQTIGGAIAFVLAVILPAALSFSYFTLIIAGVIRTWVAVLDGCGGSGFGGRNNVPHQVRRVFRGDIRLGPERVVLTS